VRGAQPLDRDVAAYAQVVGGEDVAATALADDLAEHVAVERLRRVVELLPLVPRRALVDRDRRIGRRRLGRRLVLIIRPHPPDRNRSTWFIVRPMYLGIV